MTYEQTEIQLSLPCEDALWQANCAAEWFTVLRTISIHGTNQTRLAGSSFHKSLARLSEMRFLTAYIPLSPFSHFILVHAILRKIFYVCADREDSAAEGGSASNVEQKIHELQYALHNWLQSWDQSPHRPETNDNDEPPFISNGRDLSS